MPRTITLAKPEPLGLPVPPRDEDKHLYFGPQHRWVLAVQSLAFLGVAYSLVRFALHVEGALLFIAFVALYGVGLCVSLRSSTRRRRLTLPQHEALVAARARETSTGDRPLYALRQGIKGTLSQAVRGFGLRCARYRGLAKVHLQHVATATAAALDLDRIAAWLQGRPLAPTRISRFAALTA